MAMRYWRSKIGIAVSAAAGLISLGTGSCAFADTQPLYPKVQCATVDNTTQTVTAILAVDNQLPTVVTNPLNVFSPSSPGLPTTFVPGYTSNVFTVTAGSTETISWFLGQTSYPLIFAPPYTQVTYDQGVTFYPVHRCPKS